VPEAWIPSPSTPQPQAEDQQQGVPPGGPYQAVVQMHTAGREFVQVRLCACLCVCVFLGACVCHVCLCACQCMFTFFCQSVCAGTEATIVEMCRRGRWVGSGGREEADRVDLFWVQERQRCEYTCICHVCVRLIMCPC
jgi:hypothetical protein